MSGRSHHVALLTIFRLLYQFRRQPLIYLSAVDVQTHTIMQVVKSRIQGAEKLPGVVLKYNWTYPACAFFLSKTLRMVVTVSPCRLITIFREEGPKALYKGFVPKVLRLAPGGGVLLLVVEFTLGVFRKGTFLLSAFVKAHLLMVSLLSAGSTIYLRECICS